MKHLRTLSALALGCLTLALLVGVAQANVGGSHTRAARHHSRHHRHHHHYCFKHHHKHRCGAPHTPAATPTTATPTTTAPTTTAPTTTAPTTTAPTTTAPTTTAPTTTAPTTTAPTTTAPTTTAPTTTAPTTTAPSSTSTPSSSGVCQDSAAKYVWNDWSNGPIGDYYADADWWAAGGYSFAQKTVICDHDSWYVQATADNSTGDGAVKSYPNVHLDYHDWGTGEEPAVSSFHTMTSQFAQTSPGVGIYDVAYDIWLNGVADSGSTELMIWTDNHKQVPSGSKVGQVTLSGHTWDVWSSDSNHYIAFVPVNGESISSGTLDLLGFYQYLIANGRLPADSTVGQVDYGVEIVSTDSKPARWDFTNFNISSS